MCHFHLMMDCCWTYPILRLCESRRFQFVMGSSGHMATWYTMSRYLQWPSSKPGASIQEPRNSHLQMSWFCFRTLRIHVVTVPSGLTIKSIQHLSSRYLSYDRVCRIMWPNDQVHLHHNLYLLWNHFLLWIYSKLLTFCVFNIWIRAVSLNVEYAISITQKGLLCIFLSS